LLQNHTGNPTRFPVPIRPVSESERQWARNGASESERDFSHERQYIRASQSEWNLKRDVTFSSYNALQRDVISVASTEHMGTQLQSDFHYFNSQHQHSTNMDYFWVTRCLCKLDLLPSRDNTCILHTRVKSHKTSKNRLRLWLHPRPTGGAHNAHTDL